MNNNRQEGCYSYMIVEDGLLCCEKRADHSGHHEAFDSRDGKKVKWDDDDEWVVFGVN